MKPHNHLLIKIASFFTETFLVSSASGLTLLKLALTGQPWASNVRVWKRWHQVGFIVLLAILSPFLQAVFWFWVWWFRLDVKELFPKSGEGRANVIKQE